MTSVIPKASKAMPDPTIGASPTALHPDAEMQARVEQDTARVMAAIIDPAAAFAALVTEYRLQVEEWDTTMLAPRYRDRFMAFYLQTDDKRILVVPAGQDAGERLVATCRLLAHQEVSPR
ncbi:hypothetical protein [Streptomyces sp. NPDC002172]